MTHALLANLPRRQREVISRVIAGRTNKEIAHELCISQRTVETHRFKAMRALGFRRLPDLCGAFHSSGQEILPAHGHGSCSTGHRTRSRAIRAGAVLQHGA